MTARARIVAALATVEGLAPSETEPDQKLPGSAWPALRELNPSGTLCDPNVRSYDVYAVLNNADPRETADHAEQLLEALVEVLEPLGEWVPPAEVVRIQFDNSSTVPGIRVRIAPDPD